MADNLAKRPSKGILKSSSSFENPEQSRRRNSRRETTFDEMNIIATYHPTDKDYGHMKIEEPKTPYNWDAPEDEVEGVDPNILAEKIKMGADLLPKALQEIDDDSEEDDDETPEQRAQRKMFENKRKAHYNEFQAVKLARKLMEEEEEDDEGDDDDEEENATATSSKYSSSLSSHPESTDF